MTAFEDALFESSFREDYERARAQAEQLARRHRARLRALARRGLPAKAEAVVRAKLEREYQEGIERLVAPLRAAIAGQRRAVEKRQREAFQERAAKLVEALQGVPETAVAVFKQQAERMTPGELLETYRHGAPWQRAIIENFFAPKARPRAGRLPEPLEPEERELAKLIAESDRGTRLDDQLAHLDALERQLRELDVVNYHRELEQRFHIGEPRVEFSPAELEWADVDVGRAIAGLREAGEL